MTLHQIKSAGEEKWLQVWDGLLTEREGANSNPWRPIADRLAYAAWRIGYQQARERTIRQHGKWQ